LEGLCEKRIGEHLPKDECWMSPTYIREILGDNIDFPIVFIGDGQNEVVLNRLKSDTVIGPNVIVPDELLSMHNITDIFSIGTRVSSMALMIGLIRVLRGADPRSNYIYVHRKREKGNGVINNRNSGRSIAAPPLKVWQDCLFLCNTTKSHLCGHENLLP
jgi:hypothetical protein